MDTIGLSIMVEDNSTLASTGKHRRIGRRINRNTKLNPHELNFVPETGGSGRPLLEARNGAVHEPGGVGRNPTVEGLIEELLLKLRVNNAPCDGGDTLS